MSPIFWCFSFFEYPEKCLNKGIIQTKIAFSIFTQSANFHWLYASPVMSSRNFSISAKFRAMFYFSLCQIPHKILAKNCALFSQENFLKMLKTVSENAEKEFWAHGYCTAKRVNAVSDTWRNKWMNNKSQVTVVQNVMSFPRDGDTYRRIVPYSPYYLQVSSFKARKEQHRTHPFQRLRRTMCCSC